MAEAFFCDRCMRAFPYTYKRQIVSKGFKWGGGNLHMRDLCPECVEELKEFMNGDKTEQDLPGEEGNERDA